MLEVPDIVVHTISNPGRPAPAGGGVEIVRVGEVGPPTRRKPVCPVSPKITHVSRKGQIVIPKTIREALDLVMGDLLAVTCTEKGFLLMKKIESPLEQEKIRELAAIEEAWMRIGRGEGKKTTTEEFLKELKEW